MTYCKPTYAELPKLPPYFTDHRLIQLDMIFKLLFNFEEFIKKIDLVFTFLPFSEGSCILMLLLIFINTIDYYLLLDGSHRFIATMVWKGIVPSSYEEKIRIEAKDESFHQYYIPPCIDPKNLNHIVNTANIGANAILKENFVTKVIIYDLI